MNQRPILIIILSLLLSTHLTHGAEADTLSVHRRIMQTWMPSDYLRTQVWQNPAMNYYYRDFSLSSIVLNGLYEDRGEAALTQQGNARKYGSVEVKSFLHLTENSRVFGNASYHNGKKENILWNENEDYDLIYPYFTGDSIGGYLKAEEYSFAGGYAHKLGNWTLAGKLAYRATISYRQKDPRPRNIVSDLNISAGATRHLVGDYQIGVGLHFRKYDQESKITFMADQGSTSVYQLLGFGMDYVRFAGKYTDANYKGTGFGVSLDLIPRSANGLTASLKGDLFSFTKHIGNTSSLIPIVKLKQTTLALETAWITQTPNWEYAVNLNADYQQRTGTENIFGEFVGNAYDIISTANSYKEKNINAILSFIAARKPGAGKTVFSVMPYTGYHYTNPRYIATARSFEIASLETGLTARVLRNFSNLMLSAIANGRYSANLTGKKQLTGLNTQYSLGRSIVADYNYLADSFTGVSLSARGDYVLSARHAVYMEAGWRYQGYKTKGNAQSVYVTLGYTY